MCIWLFMAAQPSRWYLFWWLILRKTRARVRMWYRVSKDH